MTSLRALSIAVISVSCSQAQPGNLFVDSGPREPQHDSRIGNDAQHVVGDGSTADSGPTVDAPLACKPANILHGDGQHNPGMDCMGSCHNHGFSVAGTVYLADGVTPASDATVTVIDANNGSQDVIVSTNGNFFSYIPVAFPITIRASLCPTTQFMTETAAAGGCNATGCHEPGGLQGPTHL